MPKRRPGEKIKMLSVDELLGVPSSETAQEIDVDLIEPFVNHPFKVVDDEKMHELVESIMKNGVLTPVILREAENGKYTMISGHRRLFAAKFIGFEKIPAIIKNMTDDEAVIAMVDSNIQREEILPSEKAHAYKMRYEAMRRQGKRSDLTSSQVGTKLRADEQLAADVGESRNQVHRFIRLAELIPELLELVDKGWIAIMTGVDISYLDEKIQKWIFEYIKANGVIKSYQIVALRRYLDENENIKQSELIKILNDNLSGRVPSPSVTFNSKKLYKYFPAYYTKQEMEEIMEQLLMKWKKEQEGVKDGV